MARNRKTAVLIAVALLCGVSTAAMADHKYGGNRAVAVSVSGNAFGLRARTAPVYDYARVISSRPVVRYVTVTTPVRECWEETEYYTVNHRPPGTGGSALVGAIIGGVVGHQFGSGRGNDAATVAGSLIGAAIGSDVARKRQGTGYGPVEYSRPVRRCETQYREQQEERIDGYDVTYRYNGQKYATRMPYDPGDRIRVRVDIRPAG